MVRSNTKRVPSGPNSVLTTPTSPPTRPFHALASSTRSCRPQVLLLLASIHIYEQPPLEDVRLDEVILRRPESRRWVLLRKEVIQPHLPVRLPCYDFVPIASPTFDRSLPYGLGHGLRVLPTFVT